MLTAFYQLTSEFLLIFCEVLKKYNHLSAAVCGSNYMENRLTKTTEYYPHPFIMAGAILLAWYGRSKMHFIIHGGKIKVPCPVMCTFHLVLMCIHAQYLKTSAILLTVNIVGVIETSVLLHLVNGLS